MPAPFQNPFRPGAGHTPPFLAGRTGETAEFGRLLDQAPILENIVLTGLRGVGKSVLLQSWRPVAVQHGWTWVGDDMSETASSSEVSLAQRLLADLAVATSALPPHRIEVPGVGFEAIRATETRLDHSVLSSIFNATPGLVSDKLAHVVEVAVAALTAAGRQGVVFAYDEAQTLSDSTSAGEHPISLLLHVFQSVQRKGYRALLVLAGLPTLFPKLVEARTYAERMFRVLFLQSLDRAATRDAILEPLVRDRIPVAPTSGFADAVYEASGGYPYFIQFICREAFDILLDAEFDIERAAIPLDAIIRKLDTDFFAGRWARATDRQRDLLAVVAQLASSDSEFTVQEIVEESRRRLEKPFSNSHANQILATLGANGLVFKNRHGKYMLAVPLLADFIRRTTAPSLFE